MSGLLRALCLPGAESLRRGVVSSIFGGDAHNVGDGRLGLA